MEAKEKAKELFLNMHYKCSLINGNPKEEWKQAKQCALICVDEQQQFIIEEMIGVDWRIRKIFIDELEDVKQEINKL
tara:strand:+ start:1452 stop:1682 length:231 start_codon:yes stop_codon:yes gene_type:complete